MIPLSKTNKNDVVKVKFLKGDVGFQQRLYALGLIKNKKIEVHSSNFFGYIIKIDNAKFTFREEVADKIMVERVKC